MITATIFFLTLSQSMSKRELLDCFAYTRCQRGKSMRRRMAGEIEGNSSAAS